MTSRRSAGLTCHKSIIIIPKRNRLRIYVDGADKYYRLRDLKRALPEVVVKVSGMCPVGHKDRDGAYRGCHQYLEP